MISKLDFPIPFRGLNHILFLIMVCLNEFWLHILILEYVSSSLLSLKILWVNGGGNSHVEGWEDHKFMQMLQPIKIKLKFWNEVTFGDIKESRTLVNGRLLIKWSYNS